MTTLLMDSLPWAVEPMLPEERPALRLVGRAVRPRRSADGLADGAAEPAVPVTLVPIRFTAAGQKRSVSPAVRRRRTLVAFTGLLLIGLGLPLGGAGGNSHAAGSALAGNGRPAEYTVQPGDSLWSIAERVDPTADPRPLVARLASQTGSESVVPGERISLP